jgi:hypothetical protein
LILVASWEPNIYPSHALTFLDRYLMYGKVSNPALMPPTSDALKYHIHRAHLQASTWLNAATQHYIPMPSTEHGWTRDQDEVLTAITMTLPAMPKACKELVFCNCKTGCRTDRCQCRSLMYPCTMNCNCCNSNVVCMNVNAFDGWQCIKVQHIISEQN